MSWKAVILFTLAAVLIDYAFGFKLGVLKRIALMVGVMFIVFGVMELS